MVWLWIGFISLILFLLALDLGVFHRKAHVVGIREALGWSAIWVSLALGFSVFVYFAYENHWLGLGLPPGPGVINDRMAVSPDNPQGINDGASATVKYLTGYVIEESLSMDNIFVIAMILSSLAVPAIYQHRVLFWGILGALIMRGLMIVLGAALIQRFSVILYVFGAFLVLTGLKMLLSRSEMKDPGQSRIVRWARRFLPLTEQFHGKHFFVRAGSDASGASVTPGGQHPIDRAVQAAAPGALMMTPLFIALLLVEFTDLIFAVDSIPAIFAITTDSFLVFTSNVFAILGLRSLYFALAGLMARFRYLKVALSLVLLVVGIKMLTHTWLKELLGKHFNFYLLAAVLLILAGGVLASIIANRRAVTSR